MDFGIYIYIYIYIWCNGNNGRSSRSEGFGRGFGRGWDPRGIQTRFVPPTQPPVTPTRPRYLLSIHIPLCLYIQTTKHHRLDIDSYTCNVYKVSGRDGSLWGLQPIQQGAMGGHPVIRCAVGNIDGWI